MVGAGCDLDAIEETVIDSAPLDAEGRDALWLYAWTLKSRRDGALSGGLTPQREAVLR